MATAGFKKPKDVAMASSRTPSTSMAPNKADKKMQEDLGLDDLPSDDSVSSDESLSDSNEKEGKGMMLQYITLQQTLRRITTQKVELTEQFKESQESYRKLKYASDKAAVAAKQQQVIMRNAQHMQIADLSKLIEDLKLAMQEGLQAPTDKSEAVSQLSESVATLSNEKREQYERAERLELSMKQLTEDLKVAETEYDRIVGELKKELGDAQRQLDPTKAVNGNIFASAADSEEITALREEAAELRAKLREAEYARPITGGASSEDVTRLQSELQAMSSKQRNLKEELQEAHAQVAKLSAVAATGSDREKSQAAHEAALSAQQEQLKKKTRDLENQVEELTQKLRSESQGRERANTELSDLKKSMESEMSRAQGAAAAGEDAKKSAQTQLQSTLQELAAEKAAHKSEAAARAATASDLQAAQASLAKMKNEVDRVTSDASAELQKEKERSVTALQKVKTDAAAEIAEAKQRAKDSMRDLQERLSTFAGKVQPMVATIKFLSKNYKELKKQTRELQGEIAPAVKQCKRDLLRTLAEVDTQYKEMVQKYRKEMALRKKLHNELVDLKGNIRVFGRVRPIINEDGKGEDSKVVCQFDREDDQMVYVQNKGKVTEFQLDQVFKMDSKQEDVFLAMRDLIVSVADGFNVCIFAYGQTGSGKTFTMDGNDASPGLNRRALSELFQVLEDRKVDWSFEIEVSVIEIYNENIRDLLADNPKLKLDIKHGKDGPFVPGLTTHPVRSAQEVREQFKRSQKNRTVASTQMNDVSSRSHALLVVYITGTNLSTGVQTKGKLNLIDLAGSERVAKSGALDDEDRLREATNINKSLSSLGDVIHALGAKQKHIPYRNSKLTHLLQDSLGGAAKTLMVVQISPVLKNVSESVCSLQFATRVRAVELGASKKTQDNAEVAILKKRIAELENGQA